MELFEKNKGKLGAFKLESLTSHIAEFAGCASKMYSLLLVTEGGEYDTSMKGKWGAEARSQGEGQARHVSRHGACTLQMLRELPRNEVEKADHRVVLELNKRMLTAYNDKVYQIAWDESRPLGHYRNEDRLSQLLNRFSFRACFRKLRDSKL